MSEYRLKRQKKIGMSNSRIPGLYKLSVCDRIAELERLGWLSPGDARDLQAGKQVISAAAADKIIENVVGVFGLPMAIAPNFIVNERECIVPLVVEEPSIVAALSSAAALARTTGGFTATLEESLLAGQIHVAGVRDAGAAIAALRDASDELISIADAVHPRLKERGGGVRDIEFRELQLQDGSTIVAVHVLVDTCDAMGANLTNTLCESLAPRIGEICSGDIALRILSNLADRSVCSATVRYAVDSLATDSMRGPDVRDRIVLANEIAIADPHRATTHNKGILNGIDPLAIATGNDWRAIEAGAHAYAARSGRYSALTRWSVDSGGDLLGEIKIPLKPGIVGGTVSSNPAAALGLSIAAVESAAQLAELMAAVGLAQNFSALRALATSGIQKGHMRLHARSVATSAGTPEDRLDEVVDRMVESGEIKTRKAREILAGLSENENDVDVTGASAAGKIILLGEHAVVYGRHALAVPIPDAVHATAVKNNGSTTLTVRDWGLHSIIESGSEEGLDALVNRIIEKLGATGSNFSINVRSSLPPGMGLGSSAAIAVAITRALALCLDIRIEDAEVNDIAFDCEKLAHGTPSGIDNTLSCYAKPVLFRNAGTLEVETLALDDVPPLIIGFSRSSGSTREQVAGVKTRFDQEEAQYNSVFDQIDDISKAGAKALSAKQYNKLGSLMNLCHGLLNAIGVSTPDLENMVSIARNSGAIGAKLTGAGGGGSIVALCPDTQDIVRSALHQAGYKTLQSRLIKGQTIE
jgi:hydroxymethylglutaryl-CoA reductase